MNLKNKWWIAVLFAGLSFNLQAESNSLVSFSPDQKKQIEHIVHDYLLQNPQIIVEVVQQLQKKQQVDMNQKAIKAIKENRQQVFDSATSPVIGNPNGKVTLVEFFDYQCPHCRDVSPTLESLVNKNKDLRVVYKEFPIFPGSDAISAAALAANKQHKYQVFHQALMKVNHPIKEEDVLKIAAQLGINVEQFKKDMNDASVKSELQQNMKLASQLGIMGTPCFIVASNIHSKEKLYSIFIPGVVSESVLEKTIQEAAKHS